MKAKLHTCPRCGHDFDDRAAATKIPPCPAIEIVKLYHALLPELRRVLVLTDARRSLIAQRWRKDMTDMQDWQFYFETFVRPSDFLMGRSRASNGHRAFRADLEWLTRPANYAKTIEGKYANDAAK
jgi:hypothetical protein